MKTKTMFVLTIIGILTLCLSVSQPAVAATDEEDVLQVAENWNLAANTANFELLSSLYWHSPKLSEFAPLKAGAFLMQGWDTLEQWFKTYFEVPKGTVTSTYSNPLVTMITNDVAVLTFYQTLILNPPLVAEQTIIHNRVTLVVQKMGGKWVIVHDHASVFPTE